VPQDNKAKNLVLGFIVHLLVLVREAMRLTASP